MKFILPINAVLNAIKCQAKGDQRYYLSGIHITQHAVEASNGHYLYQAKLNKDLHYPDYLPDWRSSFDLPESMIIRMKQRITNPIKSSGCEFVIFEVDEKEVIVKPVNKFGEIIACYLGEVIEGKFPNTDNLIPSGEPDNHARVGYNSAYLKKINDIAEGRFKTVTLQSHGEHKASVFKLSVPHDYYTPIFVLMPVRL